MTDPVQSEHDDGQWERVLQPLDDDAAPIDSDLLARLREITCREIATSASEPVAAAQTETSDAGGTWMTVRRETQIRGRGMLVLATRTVFSAVALVVSGLLWFFAGVDVEADSTLGKVLDETRKAKSLQLKVVRDGDLADVWMHEDGRLRYEESPTNYRIADGTSLWEIDEESNVARRSDDEQLASAAANLDLLALLGVDDNGSSILRRARPIGVVPHDGTRCRLYRVTTTVAEQKLMFEAFVDQKTGQLRSIAAWPAGFAKRKGPPVAEVRLVARNVEIQKGQFEWKKSLSEDGRIGKITDRQGIVLLRPKLNRRWTPICREMRLKPGDQLRTDVRGANAVAARLTSGAAITLGPGTLAELISPTVLHLHYGEVQVVRGSQAEFEVRSPMQKSARPSKDDSTVYQIDRERNLIVRNRKPMWLLGFEGASANESIGSLITKVDGREVPLTIGYHKVKVEIRDQIARTTIEESFVNRTDGRLEGIFHFPLPQDASISGFGMWIGNELVEADVVEKQRAREIYETILREKRDPGLLEWTGGNIFKARVFPIEAHSEKRIKIVYTQVLPLRADQYRYSYALRSEMLQKTPLRELSIDVLVSSALPIRKIHSPTHPVRIESGRQSASVQFSAQEYSPKKDFELVCDLGGRTSDVVTIPHRRGDDGYFMLQLMPPGADGNWQREVLPDGEPLEILLVCDTSGSMDKANRKTQAAFVGAMLTALGKDDRFNIAVCDAETKFLFRKPVSADEVKIDQARDWLDKRVSLGWTDLESTFAAIRKRVGAKTHVIYVGDGVVTARDINPQTFAARLRQLYGKKSRGTFHAVSTGSSFESVVLKAIASLGRGSVRSIGSGQTTLAVAMELLNEMAQPGLRDLSVEFKGLQVAAVYPKELPNLAAGTQQILLGRYLPTGDDQSGEIIVTGTRGGETVRYSAKIPLKEAEKGNSFIPRLWARAHLDQLLQQGTSEFIRDEIISLSEEFHIITPYTSLLVLESDADRERFGVTRRFEMRDGERFFADGRDAARYELMQKVIREAGNWRLGLRYQILRELSRLGRSEQTGQQILQMVQQARQVLMNSPFAESSPAGNWFSYSGAIEIGGYAGDSRGWGGGGFGTGGGGGGFFGGSDGFVSGLGGGFGGEARFESEEMGEFGKRAGELETDAVDKEEAPAERLDQVSLQDSFDAEADGDGLLADLEAENKRIDKKLAFGRKGRLGDGRQKNRALDVLGAFGLAFGPKQVSLKQVSDEQQWGGRGLSGGFYGRYQQNYVAWLNTLFPRLPAPRRPVALPGKKSDWPAEAVRLSRSLLKNDWLDELKGGLEIRQSTDYFNPKWNRHTFHSNSLELYSRSTWVNWSVSGGSGKSFDWLNENERGAISETYLLGRVRKSVPEDARESLSTGYFSFGQGLHTAYPEHNVEISAAGDLRVLTLTHPNSPTQSERIFIDSTKKIAVKVETLKDGKVTSSTTYSDPVQVQGAWWPRKTESVDEKGRITSTTTLTMTELTDEAFARRNAEEMAIRNECQLLQHPVPTVEEAETAVKDGSAGFEDRLVLIVRSSQIQKWDEAFRQLEELEEVVGDKAGRHWIRLEIQNAARRSAEALALAETLSEELTEAQSADLSRAEHLIQSAWQNANANEVLDLLVRLKPVYDRQPEYASAVATWLTHQVRGLRTLSRTDEMLAVERNLAESQPWAIYTQTQYARDLVSSGNPKAAYGWLRKVLDRDRDRFGPFERDQVWRAWADLLQHQGESAAQIEVVRQWLEEKPEDDEPYSRYLSSLNFDDQTDTARTLALQWLKLARAEEKLSQADRSRTMAAIRYGLGQGWNIYYNVVTPDWYEPLQETALYFMKHEHHFEFCSRIMDSSQYSDTDSADVVRVAMMKELQQNAATLKPIELQTFVRWVQSGKPDETAEDWRPIAEAIRARWEGLSHTDKPDDEKDVVGTTLTRIYAGFFRDGKYFPFLRERIAQSEKSRRDQYTMELFNALLDEPWTEQGEVELFGLLPELGKNSEASVVATQVEAAHRLVDRLLAARVQADEQQLQDTGHPEKLSRIELARKKAGFRTASREGIAARLNEESKKHDGLLGQWLQMDRMYLDMRLNRNREGVAAECVLFLGEKPPTPSKDDDGEENELAPEERVKKSVEDLVRAALQQRALITFANLAVRKSAKPEQRNWLLAYVDAGIESDDEDTAGTWKSMKYNLLIALNQPRELEKAIREWIRTAEYETTWQRMLAQLAAERGELDEAIRLYEKMEKDTQLTRSDYSALANWYLARDDREKHHRAKVEAMKVVQEYQLSNFIREHRYRWSDSSRPLPGELDEDVLFAFEALFEKSRSPGNYLYLLREFYQACRDFRLLKMVPDFVVGRSSQQVYSVLSQLRTTVLEEMRKEATADEILARIEELRERDLTEIDRRALDLLEAMIERQSAEVLNQPGPHLQASLAAMKRAFEREWADGEERQMAQLLHSLGKMPNPELAEEQLRELETLYRREKSGTDDRLFCGWYLSDVQFAANGRRDDGLTQMEIVIREFEQAHPDGWPNHASTPFSGYVGMLEQLGRHSEAEGFVRKHLEKPLNSGQKNWLVERLTSVYTSALSNDSRVSLGEGAELYGNLVAFILKQVERGDDNHRYGVLQRLQSVFRTARQKGFPTLRQDMRQFAFEALPKILKKQRNNYRNLISNWSSLLAELLDSRIALEFLVERMESYPGRFMHNWENPWSQFGYRIGDWRRSVKDLGELEPRLLALVLKELRRDLESRNRHSRYVYTKNSYYWEEKEAEFIKVAEDVLRTHRQSSRYVRYIADYFWGGLHKRKRAIEILFVAMNDGLLDDNALSRLVDWLQYPSVRDFAASIPILEGLVERNPHNMHYRCELITAYHHTSRPNQRDELIVETDELFRNGGRWTESSLRELSACVHEISLHELTVKYVNELIPLHQRNQPNRGIGQGSLPRYYMWLANAHSKLKHTERAIDAAAAAIVSWGPRNDQRTEAIDMLNTVTREAADLDEYVALMDRRAQESGEDSSVIRRSIGQAYAVRGEQKKAIDQLRIAVELQPGDLRTHQLLIAAYAAVDDLDGEVRQWLALIDIDRHNLQNYTELEKRLRDDEELAERAATAVVEAAPNEAEHHQELAKIRSRQKRYADAVLHWQKVAELRALEPNGLINLAKAQLLNDQAALAQKTMKQIQDQVWPSRFDDEIREAVREFDRLRQAP